MPDESSRNRDFKRPNPEELGIAIASVRPIIQIALKVIRMIQDGGWGAQDLAEEIKQDQVISARLLRMCNSAFFYTGDKIDSIDRALVFLGEKQLLKMILSATLKDFFASELKGYSLSKGGLFNHAFGTAVLCKKLAELTGKVPDDLAYTAGLLHDIGKVVLDQYMDTAYSLFYRRTQVEAEELIHVERELFGIDHAGSGGRLAEQWSFPECLIEAISHHHYPERASSESSELTHLVYFADLLMSRFMVGQELEQMNTDSIVARLKRIGLTLQDIPSLIERIPLELFTLPNTGLE
jgi:putative nucleotidyltransferase with HDIG domain